MRIGTRPNDDIVYELADPRVNLDLSSERWFLTDDQASVMVGRDVIRPGSLRIEGGRRPVGVTIPVADQPIVAAYGIDFKARVPVLFQDHWNNAFTRGSTIDYVRYASGTANGVLLGLVNAESAATRTTTPFAWPRAMIGGTFIYDESERRGSQQKFVVVDVRTLTEPDDSLILSGVFEDGANDKFNVYYWREYDKRGIWVTNGRKFWLLQGGEYIQFLDLGSDEFLGAVWRMTKISERVMMLVHPKYPPRIIRLRDDATTEVADDGSVAGLLAPTRPLYAEQPGTDVASWDMRRIGSEASMTAGTCRCKVRAINLYDRAESKFVQVYDSSDKTVDFLTVQASDSVDVFTDVRANQIGPIYHKRWSHLEFWRTLADGVSYYMEKRVEIPQMPNEKSTLASGMPDVMIGKSQSGNPHVHALADADLSGLQGEGIGDIISGGMPPICKQAISLGRVTICMGQAADDAQDFDIDGQDYFAKEYLIPSKETVTTTPFDSSFLSDYTVNRYGSNDNDRFDIVKVGAGPADLGQHDIIDKDTSTFRIDTDVEGQSQNIRALIRRNYTVEWPTIESDEHVGYSRTDLERPESFPTRKLVISTIGDTFRRMVRVGNYVAAIMDSGVHLLFLAPSLLFAELRSEAVAATGEGTPWEDSVIVVSNTVLWATPEGIKVMSVSNEVDADGKRGSIRLLSSRPAVRQWFRDAFDAAETIDAGLDTVNHCVRWRRHKTDGSFQALQYSYRTGLMTLLDDDNGIRYAATTFAEGSAKASPVLYSVDGTGAAFEVNYQGIPHPYDDVTVQAVLDDTYTIQHAKILKKGAFSALMAGDVVRFRPDSESVDDVARVITGASADWISFDSLPGLAVGYEFVIGAVRFRYRPAHLVGGSKISVKTLEQFSVRAIPGDRHSNGRWPKIPNGKLTARAFAGFEDDPDVEEIRAIPIFRESDKKFESNDRFLALHSNGHAIEVELEMTDARTDFRLESIEAVIREEGDQIADATTDE